MSDTTSSRPIAWATDLESRATITVEEAAAVIGIGRTAAYEAARRGELPVRRLGRRLIVPVPALLAWLGVVPAELGERA